MTLNCILTSVVHLQQKCVKAFKFVCKYYRSNILFLTQIVTNYGQEN